MLHMKISSYSILIGMPLVLLFTSCRQTSSASFRSPYPEKSLIPQQASPGSFRNPIGTVTVINQLHQFVLLDVSSLPYPPVGTLLACVSGSQQTALLRVASPSRPPFLIADIVQGQPVIGNQIFLQNH